MIRINIQCLHLFTDDKETFVAYDELDVLRVAGDFHGGTLDEELKILDGEMYYQVKDSSQYSVVIEETDKSKYDRMPFAKMEKKEYGLYLVTAPAWVWAFFNGRGFLCGMDW